MKTVDYLASQDKTDPKGLKGWALYLLKYVLLGMIYRNK